MADENTPTVRQDLYDIQEHMLEVVQTYFPDDSGEEIALSTLRPTLFGYLADVVAATAEAAVFHRNALHDELFLNTASMDSSIYNFAKLYDYQVRSAVPATVTLSLAIREKDVFMYSALSPEKSTVGSARRFLKLDQGTKFFFGDYEFHLPHPVTIAATKFGDSAGDESLFTGGFWSYDVRYTLEQETLPGYRLDVPFVKSWKTAVGEDSWLIFSVTALQISIIESEYEVFTADTAAHLSFTTEFEGDMAGFEVTVYEKTEVNGEFVWKTNSMVPVFNASSPPVDVSTHYFYYSYPTENSIQVYFGFLPDWRPSFGSKITLRMCSTLGRDGNFSYTERGEIGVEIVTPETDPRDGLVFSNLERIQAVARNLTDSAGGRERPTMKEIKEEMIKKLLLRDNIITELDLNIFFETVAAENRIRNSVITFVKRQDDIIRRIYAGFILLRDDQDRVVPTNTVDLLADYAELERGGFVIRPGEIVIFDETARVYRFLQPAEYPESYLSDKTKLVYSLPYLLRVQFDPFPRLTYYRISTNKGAALQLDSTPLYEWEVIANSARFERRPLYDSYYLMSVNVVTNIDALGASPLDQNKARSEFIKVRAIFRNPDPRRGEVYGCVDLSLRAGSTTEWVVIMPTRDRMVSDPLDPNRGMIELVDEADEEIFRLPDGTRSANQSIFVPENFLVEIAVLYDALGCEGAGISHNVSVSSYEDTGSVDRGAWSAMIDLRGEDHYYGVAAVFKTAADDRVSFHRALSDVMISEMVINSNATILLKDVPVIGTRYYADRTASAEVDIMLESFEGILLDNMLRLQNNTQTSIKLYNTCGVSHHFDTDTTNVFLDMKIKLRAGLTVEIDAMLKNAIAAYVETSNDLGLLSYSNLITHLETNFPEISFINVVGINRLGQQSIERTVARDPAELEDPRLIRTYVPEHLSVNLELKDGQQLVYSVKIEYI